MADIHIRGARQHNLKNIEVTIPRDKLVVVTGLSGSGKSSLAFDTLYAEGQRRYVESLSSYARQFLDQMEKPDVDHIDGLSPAIAIEQRSGVGSPRSIVATSTEIYDYLRLLYAHIGVPHCPQCAAPVRAWSVETIVQSILAEPAGAKLLILAPLAEGRKGEHRDLFEKAVAEGFSRIRVDGVIHSLEEPPALDKNIKHSIEIVVDRLRTGGDTARLAESVETALRHGQGVLKIFIEESSGATRERVLSEHFGCTPCGVSFPKLQPRDFSFNSPYGACPDCTGLGAVQVLDTDLIAPEPRKAVKDAFPFLKRGPRRLAFYYRCLLDSVARYAGFDTDDALDSLTTRQRDILLYGTGKAIPMVYKHAGRWHESEKVFEGVANLITRRMTETNNEKTMEKLMAAMIRRPCPGCGGARLQKVPLAVRVQGQGIHEFCRLSVGDALAKVRAWDLNQTELVIAAEVVKEISSRLRFLQSVGLDYLSLSRESGTLSGGEAQRIRLATQLGSGLTGVIYILDEPSIGLHQRDNDKLLATLRHLRDLGNTVVVVEHDTDTIATSDYLIDMGPGAGRLGGQVVYSGPPAGLAHAQTTTALYMSGRKSIALPDRRHPGNGRSLRILGAKANNLQGVDVTLPLGTFTCVTGVSGSGKSSLVNEVLKKHLMRHLGLGTPLPGECKGVEGMDEITKLIVIDQSPIGRTPRSNPATYTEAFSQIRDLFALCPEARARGYGPGRFSFNVKGGRCEECKGDGYRKIEMNFLPDVFVECEVCKGRRYNQETLGVRFKGRSIADVLAMTVDEAVDFFNAIPRLKRILGTLQDVGLGYVHLGQAATTLSGGEAQRVKLAAELARIPRGHTLYILDEPTTGLHIADIHKLLEVLFLLRSSGNSVLVIEHNLDVIKVADHVIDMGPEGGGGGGRLVASGTPEDVALCPASHTGRYLIPLLGPERLAQAQTAAKTAKAAAKTAKAAAKTAKAAAKTAKAAAKTAQSVAKTANPAASAPAVPAEDSPLRLGPKSDQWLRTLGVSTLAQVRERTPVALCMDLRRAGFVVSFNLACALQGALDGCAWNKLDAAVKRRLAREYKAAMAALDLERSQASSATAKAKTLPLHVPLAPQAEDPAPAKKRGRPAKKPKKGGKP